LTAVVENEVKILMLFLWILFKNILLKKKQIFCLHGGLSPSIEALDNIR
jgi:diadenosine tetraphosphatase ApaH/serine/threonine PP2A family protein phosphatase